MIKVTLSELLPTGERCEKVHENGDSWGVDEYGMLYIYDDGRLGTIAQYSKGAWLCVEKKQPKTVENID